MNLSFCSFISLLYFPRLLCGETSHLKCPFKSCQIRSANLLIFVQYVLQIAHLIPIMLNSIEYINSSRLPNEGRNQQICNYTMPPKSGNVCAVDVNNWGPCSPNRQYGFNNSAPCVFIKLNRVRINSCIKLKNTKHLIEIFT